MRTSPPPRSIAVLLLTVLSTLSACDSSGPLATGPERTWIDGTFELVSVDDTPIPGVVQVHGSSTWRVEESRLHLEDTGEATLYRRSTATHGAGTNVEEVILEWSGPYAIEGDRIWLGRPSTECDDTAQCTFAEDGVFASDAIALAPLSWGDRRFHYERQD